jgi:ribosomal protein S18 acetylase RimI-like enzyme
LTVIRSLASSRWKDYRKLRLESLKRSPLAFGSSFEEEASLGEAEWKKRMKSAYFAMAGDAPIGMVVCSFNKEVKFRHIAEVFSFYVRAGYRGRGVGTALLEHALRLARDNKEIIKARLYVNSRQSAAVRMYEKAGFAVVGRLEREMKVGRTFYTMLVMEKQIRR